MTKELKIYGDEDDCFRLIDTFGFEQSPRKVKKAIKYIKDWTKETSKDNGEENRIDLVWFCVDGVAKRLYPETIELLAKAISMWGDIPIIAVITKSFAQSERDENIKMVYNAFARNQKLTANLRDVIPVVSTTFMINEVAYAPPEGLTELIEKTNALLPEAIQNADGKISKFKLNRRKTMSQGIVGASVAAAVVVAAVPIPFQDAVLLTPIETTEVMAINKVFGLKESENAKQLTKTIVECGVVGSAAKMALSALKAVPGINIAAAVLNAVVAGVIVAIIGEVAILANEQLYLGNRSFKESLDWVVDLINERLSSNEVINAVKNVLKNIGNSEDKQDIIKAIQKNIQ